MIVCQHCNCRVADAHPTVCPKCGGDLKAKKPSDAEATGAEQDDAKK